MRHHDLISALYTMREMLNCHLGWLKNEENTSGLALEQREAKNVEIMEKIYAELNQSLELTRELDRLMNETSCEASESDVRTAWRSAIFLLASEGVKGSGEMIERIPESFTKVSFRQDELEEVFYHLAKNAMQLNSGAKLIIRVQLVFVPREELLASISVIDTGIGISESQLRFLFEPFYTTKPWGKGNGLGLWIVRRLVKKNNGTILIQTYEGCGSAFVMHVPLAKKAANRDKQGSIEPERRVPCTKLF
jgi:two-component system, NtrC family, sensor kinase